MPAPALTPDPPAVACSNCRACCCRLEVMLLPGDDDVPQRFMVEDRWGGSIMRRLDDGWCAALDRATMLCTIYARRPAICRDFETGSHDCLVERRRRGVDAVRETHTVLVAAGSRRRPET